jgi:hypothetical protein
MRLDLRKYLLTFLLLLSPLLLTAAVTPATADSISKLLNHSSEVCDSSCAYYAGEHSAMGLWNSVFTFLLVVLGALWLYSTYKKKYILLIGGIFAVAVAASYLIPEYFSPKTVPANCPVMPKDSTNGKVFLPPTDEFESVDSTKSTADTTSASTSDKLSSTNTDEFQSVDAASTSEFTDAASTGEFQSADAASTDEFSQAESSSEFSPAETTVQPTKTWKDYAKDPNIYEPIAIFLVLGLISLGIRNATFRKYRGLFLLASVLYLGFYRGACPCMISSWQNSFLIFLGVKVKWETLLWFLMLLPGAYLFGKLWCGWLCHLGALQEFMFKALNVKFLQGNKAQKIIKWVQISVFILWIVQLILTRTNIFCEWDPFKVAFNLISPTTTGWILLGILLVSSVLVYRPFCRFLCPVGLTLGWVSLIPGARKLDKNDTCVNCKKCDTACQQRALIHEDKITTLRVQDCILCGECISDCNVKKSLNIQSKK